MAFDLTTAKPVGGFDLSTATPVEAPVQQAEDHGLLQNIGLGALKGASDIGSTLLWPLDAAWDALSSDAGNLSDQIRGTKPKSRHEQRKADLQAFFSENANPDSLAFKGGELGADIAGTAGAGGVLAKGAQAIPALARFAPALASGGMDLGAAKSGSTVANLLMRGGAGAATGAASAGLIDPETAGAGAAIGAVMPPAVLAAARGGSLAGKVVSEPIKAIINALRSPEEQSTRLITKALARDGITPEILAQRLQELGPNAMVADAAGKNTLGLADYAATIPGQARDQGLAALEERAKGAGGRVIGALKGNLGVDSTNVDELTQGLHENMRQVAKTHGYDEILNSGTVENTPDLQKLMGSSTVKSALGKAFSILDDDIALGRADRKVLESFAFTDPRTGITTPVSGLDAKFARGVLRPAGARFDPDNFSLVKTPTLRALDYVKRGLDSIIQDGTDAITGKMSSQAERANALRRNLLSQIDTGNPDYAAVRSAYSDEKSGESALNLGRAFMRDDSEVTARRLSEMTPAEQKYFQAGAARAVMDKIKSGPNTGSAYADFIKRPGLTEKLEAAFAGNKPAFDAFMAKLKNEARMGETFASVGKNSLTAARAAAAQDAGAPIMGSSIPTSRMGLIKSGIDYLRKPSEEVSGRLLPQLLSSKPEDLAALMKSLEGLHGKMGRNVQLPGAVSPILRSAIISGLLGQ